MRCADGQLQQSRRVNGAGALLAQQADGWAMAAARGADGRLRTLGSPSPKGTPTAHGSATAAASGSRHGANGSSPRRASAASEPKADAADAAAFEIEGVAAV